MSHRTLFASIPKAVNCLTDIAEKIWKYTWLTIAILS